MRSSNNIYQIMERLGQPVNEELIEHMEEIVLHVLNEKTISALKIYRKCTGYGLLESKNFVYDLRTIPARTLYLDLQDFIGGHTNELHEDIIKKQEFNEELL